MTQVSIACIDISRRVVAGKFAVDFVKSKAQRVEKVGQKCWNDCGGMTDADGKRLDSQRAVFHNIGGNNVRTGQGSCAGDTPFCGTNGACCRIQSSTWGWDKANMAGIITM
jgi:hypothetical protein